MTSDIDGIHEVDRTHEITRHEPLSDKDKRRKNKAAKRKARRPLTPAPGDAVGDDQHDEHEVDFYA